MDTAQKIRRGVNPGHLIVSGQVKADELGWALGSGGWTLINVQKAILAPGCEQLLEQARQGGTRVIGQ